MTMQDIDFLPVQYRQRRVARRRQSWRLVVLCGTVAVAGLLFAGQRYRLGTLKAELAAVDPQFELVSLQNEQLAQLQSQLAAVRSTAELVTYLRHPWPRTQVMEGLLAPLPDDVTFSRLEIARQQATGAMRPEQSRSEREAEQAKTASLPPATRDLMQFRRQTERAPLLVTLDGTTREIAALHRYLGVLERSAMFTRVELSAMQSAEVDAGQTLRFRVELTVRPGYGQPGGPIGSERQLVAHAR
jgi:Tfp pilus assembly protein PilN